MNIEQTPIGILGRVEAGFPLGNRLQAAAKDLSHLPLREPRRFARFQDPIRRPRFLFHRYPVFFLKICRISRQCSTTFAGSVNPFSGRTG